MCIHLNNSPIYRMKASALSPLSRQYHNQLPSKYLFSGWNEYIHLQTLSSFSRDCVKTLHFKYYRVPLLRHTNTHRHTHISTVVHFSKLGIKINCDLQAENGLKYGRGLLKKKKKERTPGGRNSLFPWPALSPQVRHSHTPLPPPHSRCHTSVHHREP